MALNLVHGRKIRRSRPNRPIARVRGRIGRIWKGKCCHGGCLGAADSKRACKPRDTVAGLAPREGS